MSVRNYSNFYVQPWKTIMDVPLDDSVMISFAKQLKTEDILNLRLSSWSLRILADRILQMRQKLHIGCCEKPIPVPLAIEYCRNLRVVHFCGTSAITDEMMDVLTTNNCHIREFKVMECPKITSDGLYWLMRCQKLTHLEIASMVLLNRLLSAFGRSYIQLHELTLRYVHGFMGKNLATFFRKQKKLKRISLFSLLVLVRPSLLAIGATCRQLEKLDVQYCKGVDDQGVLCVATSCLELQTFVLSINDPLQPLPYVNPMANGTWANVSREAMEYLARKNIRTRPEPESNDSNEISEDDLIEFDTESD